jgi:hypothetical protein
MRQQIDKPAPKTISAIAGALWLVLAVFHPALFAEATWEGMVLYTDGDLWGSGKIHLAMVDADGSVASDNVIYSQNSIDPKFSPDGARIAFIRAGDRKVIVMDRDGTNAKEVATASGGDEGQTVQYGMGSWRHADRIYFSGGKELKMYSFTTNQTSTVLSSGENFRELDISENLRGVHGGMPPIFTFDLNNNSDGNSCMDGCGGSISKDGTLMTNCRGDHHGFWLRSWGSCSEAANIDVSCGGESLDPQFSGNSNDFLLCHCNSGGWKVLLYKRSSNQWKTVAPNGSNHGCDFFAGGAKPTVAQPAITPAGGEVMAAEVSVTITCATPGAEIRYTIDGSDPSASSTQYTAPFALALTEGESKTVKARGFKDGVDPSPAAAATYIRVKLRDPDGASATTAGVTYKYYEGEWNGIPDFASLTPAASGTAATFDISKAARADNFAMLFEGFISVPQDGIYTFSLSSDDSSALAVGDKHIVGTNFAGGEKPGTAGLKEGKHAISVKYHEMGGANALSVKIEGGGLSKTEVPGSMLFHIDQDAKPAVTVLAPNGGEDFSVGDTMNIRWDVNDALVNNVSLHLSVDNGKTWHVIGKPSGSYSTIDPDWKNTRLVVPPSVQSEGADISTVSTQCKIRVKNYKGQEFDDSDGAFNIAAGSGVAAAPIISAASGTFAGWRKCGGGLVIVCSGPFEAVVTSPDGAVAAHFRGTGRSFRSLPPARGVYLVKLVSPGAGTSGGFVVKF